MADSLDSLRRACAEPLPHPDREQLRGYVEQVAAWFLDHYATLPEQSIGKTAPRAEMERLLREPPPEAGTDFAHVLEEFRHKVMPFAFRTSHPRFAAFIPGAPNMFSVLGDWLCAGSCVIDMYVQTGIFFLQRIQR